MRADSGIANGSFFKKTNRVKVKDTALSLRRTGLPCFICVKFIFLIISELPVLFRVLLPRTKPITY